ncbi:hypothetical protein PAJ34TS1_28310 [Paenibacillus azoreducens]
MRWSRIRGLVVCVSCMNGLDHVYVEIAQEGFPHVCIGIAWVVRAYMLGSFERIRTKL